MLDRLALHHVDTPASQLRKIGLHFGKAEQGGVLARPKLHQHVDVAVRPEVVPQDGTEQGELDDAPTFAEGRNLLARQVDPRWHCLLAEEVVSALFDGYYSALFDGY